MEPIITSVAAKTADTALKTAQEQTAGFLKLLLGPWATAVGESWALPARERLLKNVLEVVARAMRTAKEAGIRPNEVPFKIIHPLLEAAGFEEEPDLQEIYANLIANAGDPAQSRPVWAIFAHILKELRGWDVKFLDTLYSHAAKRSHDGLIDAVRFARRNLLEVYSLAGLARHPGSLSSTTVRARKVDGVEIDADLQDFAIALDLFRRNALLNESSQAAPVDLQRRWSPYTAQTVKVDLSNMYSLTTLAISFVGACRKPEPNSTSLTP